MPVNIVHTMPRPEKNITMMSQLLAMYRRGRDSQPFISELGRCPLLQGLQFVSSVEQENKNKKCILFYVI